MFVSGAPTTSYGDHKAIASLFPHTYGQASVKFVADSTSTNGDSSTGTSQTRKEPIRIGIVLSGGPASGGHNVISGLFDFITQRVHPDSKLFGFLDGPSGLIDAKYIELDRSMIDRFRNSGGFNMIGSGRTKIEKPSHFEATAAICSNLKLDGLIVVGGDDSNTNAALIAEYFISIGHKTRCIGAPKTIDGDLRNEFIEMSFGFDTATKVYSEQVAALCADAVSARKTYHFCRLMGRTASHITLEVALQTHPNVALIGEEIQARGYTLSEIVKMIADVISTRALQHKHYGCIILPEGLVDFLPDVGRLISELNDLMAGSSLGLPSNVTAHLTKGSSKLFQALPEEISRQLLLERDSHGNVQVSKIESERLVSHLVELELRRRKKLGTYKGSPSFVCHFLGYEGRCGLPSNFDATYCYALGHVCGALVSNGRTGMIATIQKLAGPPTEWQCGGLPLTHLMNLERRIGHDKPVIRKALVRLDDRPFLIFDQLREGWKYQDAYRNPGAIQYEGPFADKITFTMEMEATTNRTADEQTQTTQADNAIRAKL